MKAIFTFLLVALLINTSYAQKMPHSTTPFVLGVVDSLQSKELSEKRMLNIYLPDGYNMDTASYPVIYLLDGSADEDFVHIVGLVQFLTMIQMMPPSIVVGVANVDRKRDFTFPTRNTKDKHDYPTTGSSAKFIAFVEKDLQPFVQKNYHTNAQKTIIGQSLGGLVASEILLRKPNLFTKYIIVSPSLWWDAESLLATANDLAKTPHNDGIKVFIAVGNEGDTMVNDATKLTALLKTNKQLQVDMINMPEEDHLTILHNAAYKALEAVNKK